MIESTTFNPDWISPPGDTIEDLLEERSWTKAELAERTGFTRKHINDLAKGRTPISPDAAQRLSRVLGSTPRFWLVRDAQYQAALMRQRALDDLRSEAGWLQELPVAWMKRMGWVQHYSHRGAMVAECLRFFGVASVRTWREVYADTQAAFRASKKVKKHQGAVASWMRKVEVLSANAECHAFSKDKFVDALFELRSLTLESEPSVFVPKLAEMCAACGVVVVFVPAPPGCPVSGATKWLAPDKAVLALSLRHKSNDHLWFTFFHEAGHLVLHGKRLQFVEGASDLDEQKEREADLFASRLLIPDEEAQNVRAMRSETEVTAIADHLGIAPGIVVGRMQKEKWIGWSQMNDLKLRYRWGDTPAA